MKRFWLRALVMLMLTACAAQPTPAPVSEATSTVALWPMPSPSLGAVHGPPTPIIIATPIPPTPLPTPVTYVVQKGDTLVYIAWLFQLSVEELQAANPNVDPRFLSVGAVLSLPDPEGDPVATTAPPTLTPAPIALTLSVPACYPTPTNVLYCFVAAYNEDLSSLENVSAQVVLADANGIPLVDATAYSALNVIPAGGAAPLVAAFPAPPGGIAASGARLLTAQRMADSARARYVVLDVISQSGQAAAEGWRVTGQVRNSTSLALAQAWLTLTMYDETGAIVGYRTATLGGLASGETHNFSISAVSLGGAVQHFTLLAEGRP